CVQPATLCIGVVLVPGGQRAVEYLATREMDRTMKSDLAPITPEPATVRIASRDNDVPTPRDRSSSTMSSGHQTCYRVKGGNSLQGTVFVQGAKNSALKMIAASLLAAKGRTVLRN